MIRTLLAASLLLLPAVSAAPVPAPDPTKDRDGLPLPKGAIARLGSLIGTAPPGAMAFSADCKHLVVASEYYRIVYDGTTGRPEQFIRLYPGKTFGSLPTLHPGTGDLSTMRAVTREPADEGRVRVTSSFAASGKVISELLLDGTHSDQMVGLGDGTTLAVVRGTEVEVYDLTTGKVTHRLPRPKGARNLLIVGMTPDRSVLVANDFQGNRILRWDLGTRKELPAIHFPHQPERPCLSADGNWLAVWQISTTPPEKPGQMPTARTELQAIDLRTGKVAHTLPFKSMLAVHAVVGDEVLIGFSRYSLTTGKTTWEAKVPPHLTIVPAVSEHRIAVASHQGAFAILDAKTGKMVSEAAVEGVVLAPRFSADGQSILAAHVGGIGTVRRWTAGGKPQHLPPVPWGDRAAGLARVLAPADRALELDWDRDGKGTVIFTVWDLEWPKPRGSYRGTTAHMLLGVLPGDRILFQHFDKGDVSLRVADPATGKETVVWKPKDAAESWNLPSVSGDGSVLVLRGAELTGINISDGKERFRLPAAVSAELRGAVTANADASFLASPTNDGVNVVDVKAATATVHAKGRAFSTAAFARTGNRLLAWSSLPVGAVAIDLTSGRGPRERALDYFRGASLGGDISPDGKRAVVGYSDGTALIWDLTAK